MPTLVASPHAMLSRRHPRLRFAAIRPYESPKPWALLSLPLSSVAMVDRVRFPTDPPNHDRHAGRGWAREEEELPPPPPPGSRTFFHNRWEGAAEALPPPPPLGSSLPDRLFAPGDGARRDSPRERGRKLSSPAENARVVYRLASSPAEKAGGSRRDRRKDTPPLILPLPDPLPLPFLSSDDGSLPFSRLEPAAAVFGKTCCHSPRTSSIPSRSEALTDSSAGEEKQPQ